MTSPSSSSKPSCYSRFWSSALRSKPLAPVSGTALRVNSGEGLVRRLSLFDLILIGIGASIGAGIFVVTGTVAHDTGPGVTISFIIAGASCVLNALCYAELASRFPAVHSTSLASYVITVLELIPSLKGKIPSWIGHGEEVVGALSINILAPVILALLTLVLCRGVGESSIVNAIMTMTKVLIVLFVIVVGSFKVDVSNWSPFAPHGIKSILTGATVVFFAYVGFDAVANSAEESKRPQRDLPLGIMSSLLVCIALYVAVCLVITGMVPYQNLGEEAPLAKAFTSKGLKYVSVLISFGAVAGLTTTLLVGLYVQADQDNWVNGFVSDGYSVVSACVVTMRWKDKTSSQSSHRWISNRAEGIIYLLAIACCGFAAGVLFRFDASYFFLIVPSFIAIVSVAALCLRQVYIDPPGFSCPGVPIVPSVSIFVNIFLFAQLHYEAWVRFVALSIVSLGIYAFYGQFHANPGSDDHGLLLPNGQSQVTEA
ncbi:hypothetical protein DH2020_002466 [Rehmannia glutinosa]|uniref:Cationic amino acid transporter C-terminal domain-containing protein n=1 Tax=Rehmannia glutinosa TaxID=99300 RepID=A0ABR0XTT5_REHGL